MNNQHSHAQDERERIELKIAEITCLHQETGDVFNAIAAWHLAELDRIRKGKLNFTIPLSDKNVTEVEINGVKYVKRANGGESLTPTGSDQ